MCQCLKVYDFVVHIHVDLNSEYIIISHLHLLHFNSDNTSLDGSRCAIYCDFFSFKISFIQDLFFPCSHVYFPFSTTSYLRACNILYNWKISSHINRATLPFLVILSKQLFKLFMCCKLQRSIRNDPCHCCTVSSEETKESIF